jgi:hypothetical protein
MPDDARNTNDTNDVAAPARQPLRRVRAFAKEHPVAMLAGAAAVGAVVGAEWAAGALVGLGAAALLNNETGRDLRERLRRRGQELIARGRAMASHDDADAPTTPPGTSA